MSASELRSLAVIFLAWACCVSHAYKQIRDTDNVLCTLAMAETQVVDEQSCFGHLANRNDLSLFITQPTTSQPYHACPDDFQGESPNVTDYSATKAFINRALIFLT